MNHLDSTPEMTDAEYLALFEYLRFKMKYDVWYPVKSDRQRELLEYMFQNLIFDCEFNADATAIRRVELNRYYNAEHNRQLTERTRPVAHGEQEVA